MSNGGTPVRFPAAWQRPSSILVGRSPDELTALRQLVQRYSLSDDGGQQSVDAMAHILRTDHSLDITVEDVLTLLADDASW